MKTNWKQWAVVGFLLAGGAYVAYLETSSSDNNPKKHRSNVYEETGMGLLIALAGAGVLAGLAKLKEYVCPASVDTAVLKEALVIAANHSHVIDELKQLEESKENKVSDTFVEIEESLRVDKRHAELCNALVQRYNEDCASGNEVDLRAFCEVADEYRAAYPTLNNLQYLAQLRTQEYKFSDLPKNLISKVITIKPLGRITPACSAHNTPSDYAQHLTPASLTPPKFQQAYSFTR